MVHTCFMAYLSGAKNSDDYCDIEVGEPDSKMKKQARNFQAH